MEIVYFYYHHGDYDFDKKVARLFKEKDFEGFIKLYEQDEEFRLPETASLYGESGFITSLDITEKAVFYNADIDSECG